VGATNSYHFMVLTGSKAFVTNRLAVTHVKLGKTANPGDRHGSACGAEAVMLSSVS